MVFILQSQRCDTFSYFPFCPSPKNVARKQQQQKPNQQKRIRRTPQRQPPFPKPSPTPLLPSPQNPSFRTKLESLDAVVADLETSIKNGVEVGTEIFASLLEICFRLNAVEHGVRIHGLIPGILLRKNVGISSKLLRLYASNGRVEDAHQVFDSMSNRGSSAFPWNSLISGYSESGLYEDGLALYFQMAEEGVEPDGFTFPRVLKACAGLGSIDVGEEVHRHVIRYGYANDEFVLNSLVDMYAKCGDIGKARKVFDKITNKDLVSWNVMLTGYIRHGLLTNAQRIFQQMIKDSHEPDSIALSAILAGGLPLKPATQIHGWVIRKGTVWDMSIANSLIALYSNHGRLDVARKLFNEMPERDIVSWNSIISAHSKNREALQYFRMMSSSNTPPDAITFVSLLSACAHLGMVKEGERLFSIMRNKHEITPVTEHYACMVNLYGRAGLIDEGYDVITNRMECEAGPTVWGALLYACYLHGNTDVGSIAAKALFDLEPDNDHNFVVLMKIYAKADRPEDVEKVRSMMLARGFDL